MYKIRNKKVGDKVVLKDTLVFGTIVAVFDSETFYVAFKETDRTRFHAKELSITPSEQFLNLCEIAKNSLKNYFWRVFNKDSKLPMILMIIFIIYLLGVVTASLWR